MISGLRLTLAILATSMAGVFFAFRLFAQGAPAWLPVDDLPPEFVRSVQTAQVQIESRNPEFQSQAIRTLEEETNRYGPAIVRSAAPLLVEVASQEYRILEFPRSYQIQSGLRIRAVKLLGRLGGDTAVSQVTDSMLKDPDPSVRGIAALTLSEMQSSEREFAAIAQALQSAHIRQDQTEVRRLLTAVQIMSQDRWLPIPVQLVEDLSAIASGSYSRSVRNQASTILLSFLDR